MHSPKHSFVPVADLGGGGGGGGGGGVKSSLLLHHFIFLLTSLLPLRCNSWPGLLRSQYRALPETERFGNETTIYNVVYPSVYVRITFVSEI